MLNVFGYLRFNSPYRRLCGCLILVFAGVLGMLTRFQYISIYIYIYILSIHVDHTYIQQNIPDTQLRVDIYIYECVCVSMSIHIHQKTHPIYRLKTNFDETQCRNLEHIEHMFNASGAYTYSYFRNSYLPHFFGAE